MPARMESNGGHEAHTEESLARYACWKAFVCVICLRSLPFRLRKVTLVDMCKAAKLHFSGTNKQQREAT